MDMKHIYLNEDVFVGIIWIHLYMSHLEKVKCSVLFDIFMKSDDQELQIKTIIIINYNYKNITLKLYL